MSETTNSMAVWAIGLIL